MPRYVERGRLLFKGNEEHRATCRLLPCRLFSLRRNFFVLNMQARECELLRQRNAELNAYIKTYDEKLMSATNDMLEARRKAQETGMALSS